MASGTSYHAGTQYSLALFAHTHKGGEKIVRGRYQRNIAANAPAALIRHMVTRADTPPPELVCVEEGHRPCTAKAGGDDLFCCGATSGGFTPSAVALRVNPLIQRVRLTVHHKYKLVKLCYVHIR